MSHFCHCCRDVCYSITYILVTCNSSQYKFHRAGLLTWSIMTHLGRVMKENCAEWLQSMKQATAVNRQQINAVITDDFIPVSIFDTRVTIVHRSIPVITFCVSRRRRKMYCGHACLSVCLSAAVCPQYCTDRDVTSRSGRGCPLVVHYWADLQSVHGLRCYGNITRTLVTSLCPSRDMMT